ncbi:MAG: alpha/beta hydrolase, partial [Bacteroidota bacterium]
LDHLGIAKTHVLGHHGGALLSMNLSYIHPERVSKVILSGTSGLKEEKEAQSFRDNLPVSIEEEWGADGELLLSAWKRYINYLPDAEVHQVLIPFINKLMSRIRPYDAHHAVLKWDRKPALLGLKDKQLLLIQGTLDHFVSKQENLLEILPLAERAVIEGAGPFLFFDKAKECAKVLKNFLAKS